MPRWIPQWMPHPLYTKLGPDISSTTPKVSLFKFTGGMGPELIAACIKQTEEFSDIAASKVQFMQINFDKGPGFNGTKFVSGVIRNATGVRLSFVPVSGGFASNTSPWSYSYSPPAIIEPGECASFLTPATASLYGDILYEVQVFEGPFATPVGGGWQAPTQEPLKIPVLKIDLPARESVDPSTAKALVQVKDQGALVPSTLTWTIDANIPFVNGAGSYTQFTLTQSLD